MTGGAGPSRREPGWEARLSTPGSPECTPDWLALREPADAAARSPQLAERLAAHLRDTAVPRERVVVRDLGCGTGSMGRWLAGRLPGEQHWILHDRDERLLERAAASLPDGVSVETRAGDVTQLDAAALAGTAVVTASALLDLLTADEVAGLAAACTGAGCAALLTLSVVGNVSFSPSEPLDTAFAAAFDDHQRRAADGRRLLGPDAPAVAMEAFQRHGAHVTSAPTPWRLGAAPGDAALVEEWLRGWLSAGCEQRPELASAADAYLRRRLDALERGELRVVVGHADLLAVPGGAA
jgi:trans-aconitate methyltransferase